MKRIKFLSIIFIIMALLCGCSNKKDSPADNKNNKDNSITYGTYEYSNNETADSKLPVNFIITIYENGTYSYCESLALSSATEGTWKISEGKLVLADYSGTNYFNIEKDKLTFISEDSDNFEHVNVKDGEEFTFRE
ncbi:MAG: hypothetical protein U0L23_03985 [Lachnospiraceae bacterium]|nr:hypothetical protein [Lachnospiraceae bacterium]